ncbi:MAG: peptidoglycan recognition protein family protein [Arenimonas sp.]
MNKLLLVLLLVISNGVLAETPCSFDKTALRFMGTPTNQSLCLLREVKRWGKLSPNLHKLPSPLSELVGIETDISEEKLRQYIASIDVKESDLGGLISDDISRAKSGNPTSAFANYFVIHDTSTPNFKEQDFPGNINESTWDHNKLARWNKGENSKAHVFVNRLGESISPVHFSVPWRATKFELQYGSDDLKGLFIHIELVQPRKSVSGTSKGNDAIGPTPGFTEAQYRRLALLYIAASVRRGSWLIPTYHTVLDAGKADGHDDPQNFSLENWANALAEIRESIQH